MTVGNSSDKEQVKKAEKEAKLRRKQELEDVKFLLSTPAGRKTYWRYLESCGVYRSSFTGNSGTFFNEGMRSIGLILLADIHEANPEAYIQMMKENRDTNGSNSEN